MQRFRSEFKLDDATMQELFDEGQPPQPYFAPQPLSATELLAITGGVTEQATIGSMSEGQLVDALERGVKELALLELPDGFVPTVYYALKAQPLLVLAGPPGTGKTAFARALGKAYARVLNGAAETIVVSVGQDFSESDALGYVRLNGDFAPTVLSQRLLQTEERAKVFLVVIDEMNLAHIDYYFARLLPAIESGLPVYLPGTGEPIQLPPDTYFIGTVNSYLAEPNRLPLSGPTKRRANVVEMPNQLQRIISTGDRSGFLRLARSLLEQSLATIEARAQAEGGTSVLDAFRAEGYRSSLSGTSTVLSEDTVTLLWEVCAICGQSPRTALTSGVLQDVLDFLAQSAPLTPRAAAGRQIAQKIVPQLSGPGRVARALRDYMQTQTDSDTSFSEALAALEVLLDTADVTDEVTFPY